MAKGNQAAKAKAEEDLKKAMALCETNGIEVTDKDDLESLTEKLKEKGLTLTGGKTEETDSDEAKDDQEEAPAPSDEARPLGIPSNAKRVKFKDIDEVNRYQKQGKLCGFNEKKGIAWVIPALILAFSTIFAPVALAAGDMSSDVGSIGGRHSDDTANHWNVRSTGDIVPGKDSTSKIGASGEEVAQIYVDTVTASTVAATTQTGTNETLTGDQIFRTNLYSNGRYGANSTVLFSSSTTFQRAGMPYAVVYKAIGNNATAEASLLPAATPGQETTFVIYARGGAGSWTLSPDTAGGVKAMFNSITFNAVGQTFTGLYLNDTLGWVPKAAGSLTMAFNTQQINALSGNVGG